MTTPALPAFVVPGLTESLLDPLKALGLALPGSDGATHDEFGEPLPPPETPEEKKAREFNENTHRFAMKEMRRGNVVEDALAAEISGVLDGALEGTDKCPKCGAELLAEQDPDTLLSFPMVFLWTCEGCGHNERRAET